MVQIRNMIESANRHKFLCLNDHHLNMQHLSVPILKMSQQVALAITPKVTSILSIIAELWIVVEVITWPCKRQQVYHRLLFGFSVADLLQSIWFFASTWPIPKETEFVYGNIGNQATCTAQGFFIQLGEAVPFYFCSLIVYYYLAIRCGMNEKAIRDHWEIYLHVVPVGFAFGSALAALFLGLYNNAGSWCWIAPLPLNCLKDPGVTCVRGRHAQLFQFLFSFVPMWICALVVLICLGRIYCNVRHQEIKSRRYRHIRIENGAEVDCDLEPGHYLERLCGWHHCPKSSQVASQAVYYVAAFYFSYSFGTLNRLIAYFSSSQQSVFGVQLLQVLFQPLQGVFNFLIYRRPTYLRLRKKNNMSRVMALLSICRWSCLDHGPQSSHSLFSQQSVQTPSRQERDDKSSSTEPYVELELQCTSLARTDIIENIDSWSSRRIVGISNTRPVPVAEGNETLEPSKPTSNVGSDGDS